MFHHVIGGEKLGIRRSLSAAGSLCFVLCGYWLISAQRLAEHDPRRSVDAALGRFGDRCLQRGEVGWRWLAGTVAVIVIFFSNGFPQYWAYPMMCYALSIFLLAVMGRISPRNVLRAVTALM